MSFHDVQFPTSTSFGSVGGPERKTDVVTLANGFEERNSAWAQSRRHYDAGMGLRSLDDVAELIAFFEARHGQLYAFRWKDWADFKSCLPSQDVSAQDQVIGTGDGQTTEFQLTKAYKSGEQTYAREITKPVLGTVVIAVQGDVLSEGVHFSVDHKTGVVTFNIAPPDQQEVSAGFEFDVPVRFDSDRIQTSVASFQAGDIPNVPLIEVRQ